MTRYLPTSRNAFSYMTYQAKLGDGGVVFFTNVPKEHTLAAKCLWRGLRLFPRGIISTARRPPCLIYGEFRANAIHKYDPRNLGNSLDKFDRLAGWTPAQPEPPAPHAGEHLPDPRRSE